MVFKIITFYFAVFNLCMTFIQSMIHFSDVASTIFQIEENTRILARLGQRYGSPAVTRAMDSGKILKRYN
jgi:hypothetical protein